MPENKITASDDISFKKLFVPLTSVKAIHIIFIIGLIVLGNGFFNGFIGDDASQIINNPLVHSFNNLPKFFTGGTFYLGDSAKLYGSYYKPILSAYYSFVYSIFGPNYVVFHFIQTLLHIINASLLFLFFGRFFGKSIALVMSLIFLIHPINSEVVFYISDTQDVLFFLFGIIALLLATKDSIKNRVLVLISFILLLSLLSKETGVLFVIAIVLYSYIFNRKYFYKSLSWSFLSFFIYAIMRLNAINFFTLPGNSPLAKLDFFQRLINMPEIFQFYIKTFFFPANLSMSYNWVNRGLSVSHFFIPFVFNSVFIGIALYFAYKIYKNYTRNYFNIYMFFFIWFVIGIVLHLQIIPLDATVADRWFYFPVVGLLGMAGVILSVFKLRLNKKWSIAIVILLLITLSARTFIRSYDWRDEWTLYSRDIKVSRENFALENAIANYLLNQERYQIAKYHAQRSVNIYPFFTNYNTLGAIYDKLREYKKAKEAFLNALKYGDYYLTYENLAVLSLSYGDPEKDITFVKNALRKFPTNQKLLLSLAILEYKNNQIENAKTTITLLYSINKSAIATHYYNIIMNEEQLTNIIR